VSDGRLDETDVEWAESTSDTPRSQEQSNDVEVIVEPPGGNLRLPDSADPVDEMAVSKKPELGEQAQQCKSGLTNIFSNVFISAKVVTDWCYSGGNVTSRHSVPSASVTNAGHAAGWREGAAEWTYSACHSFNGYHHHNCLTRRQFSFHNIYLPPFVPHVGVCIHTRIYGDGNHSRDITTDCP
jgi:hypothetical protein